MIEEFIGLGIQLAHWLRSDKGSRAVVVSLDDPRKGLTGFGRREGNIGGALGPTQHGLVFLDLFLKESRSSKVFAVRSAVLKMIPSWNKQDLPP